MSIHITNSLHGLIYKLKASQDKVNVFIENGDKVQLEFIGDVKLELEFDFILVLKNIVFVLSMRQNLIPLSKLDYDVFRFTFSNREIELFLGFNFVHGGLLCDGLYCLDVIHTNEYSSMHWIMLF